MRNWGQLRGLVFSPFFLYSVLLGQDTGTIRGTVVLNEKGTPVHGASVIAGPIGRTAETNDDGIYEIRGLPPGTYRVAAHMHSMTDQAQTVTVTAGEAATADFKLRISPVHQEVTVTASGRPQTAFEAFQTTTTVDTLELAQKSQTSLGEVLNNEPGVAKRSFGPGNSRPVIRGFDGDRVLVMQDGLPTGTLSSQSGDHGESVDPSSLERIEVLKGPATLLYGSNALGGVVNAVTGHHQAHEHPHPGLRGFLTAIGGSNNGHAGASGGFEVGVGNWLMWANGGGQRTGDYTTPIGEIPNSKTRISNSAAGVGWYGPKTFFDAGYRYEEGRYGVPFAAEFEGGGEGEEGEEGAEGEEERIDLAFRRQNLRFSGGVHNLQGFFEAFRLSLNYSDWNHKELENDEVGTTFDNKQLVYRGVFEQNPHGNLTGTLGFQGMHRDYKTAGAEALAPPVLQNNIAMFGLEEVSLEHFRLQFGGRVENNRFDPVGLRSRSFTGFSGSAGIHVPLWKGGAVVANYTHAYRAPALEELYNNGPHVGTLTFEVGNADLMRERSNGIDLSLRHESSRVNAQVNYFRYAISDFVFLAPTGEVEDGLRVAEYAQGDSRFTGMEADLSAGLNQYIWLNLGADYVNAKLTANDQPLPRIPPLRGRAGLDFRVKGFSVRPELLMANQQDRLFETETRTSGYAVFNIAASYTLAQQHAAHVFAVNLFNVGDRLYRNHLSFIKDLAPEIGRGVRFTYTVRFF